MSERSTFDTTGSGQRRRTDARPLDSRDLAWIVLVTLTVLAIVGAVLVAIHVREVLAVLFLGVVVGVTCAPVTNYFARWKVPPAVSVLVMYGLLAGVISLFLWYAIPEITAEIDRFLDDTDGFEAGYTQAAEQYNLPPLDDVRDYARQAARSLAPTAWRQAVAFASGLLYVGVILVVALTFTTVKGSAHELMLSLVPPSARPRTDEVAGILGRRLRGFVIGEFLSMLIVGVATYIGLKALGVPFPFLLAVIAFFMELLPILGPWLSAVPAIALALSESVELAIAVAIMYLVLQQIESNVLLPLVHRHHTEMPAIIVLSAVIIGGAAMGILGAIVALPVAVVIHTLACEVLIPWRQQQLESREGRARRAS